MAREFLKGRRRMNEPEPSLGLTADLRKWTKILAGYREPSSARSILEIAITVLPLMALWFLMWASLDISYWLVLLLSIGWHCGIQAAS